MALVVVGGQARKVGKTSVVEGIIRATPELEWTAIKVTHHAGDEQREPVMFEAASESGDTSRFLAAGAKCSLLARVQPGYLAGARPELERLTRAGNVIVESVGVMEFLDPDLFLLVVDPANADFKESARRYASRASAVLAHPGVLRWPGVELPPGCPVFRITRDPYASAAVIEFVRGRLGLGSR